MATSANGSVTAGDGDAVSLQSRYTTSGPTSSGSSTPSAPQLFFSLFFFYFTILGILHPVTNIYKTNVPNYHSFGEARHSDGPQLRRAARALSMAVDTVLKVVPKRVLKDQVYYT